MYGESSKVPDIIEEYAHNIKGPYGRRMPSSLSGATAGEMVPKREQREKERVRDQGGVMPLLAATKNRMSLRKSRTTMAGSTVSALFRTCRVRHLFVEQDGTESQSKSYP
jgi:hypothetical protein